MKENRRERIVENVCIAVIILVTATVLVILSGASPLEACQMFFRGIFGNL